MGEMIKSKFELWKQAVRNTPPERTLKINMQGYVLQSIGIIVVSILLLFSEMWWLIFIFIFSLFNNFSGFVQSYKQYCQIVEMKKELNLKEPEDKSPHRKKAKLIKKHYGKKAGWLSAICSVFISYVLFGTLDGWYWNIPLVLCVAVLYYLIYFRWFGYLAKSKQEKK